MKLPESATILPNSVASASKGSGNVRAETSPRVRKLPVDVEPNASCPWSPTPPRVWPFHSISPFSRWAGFGKTGRPGVHPDDGPGRATPPQADRHLVHHPEHAGAGYSPGFMNPLHRPSNSRQAKSEPASNVVTVSPFCQASATSGFLQLPALSASFPAVPVSSR